MLRKTLFASLLATSAIALTVATPAIAGKADRAREAIAAAEAKIHTAESIGTAAEAPGATAEARAELAIAKENLARGRETSSLTAAIRASALADAAIGEAQQRKQESLAAAQDAQRQDVAAAQDQAAIAQQQAAEANARATAAQQSAATSAADAAAARNAAALAAQGPAQVETTVTTQPAYSGRRSTRTTKTVTKRAPAPVVSVPAGEVTTTTTRVTQP